MGIAATAATRATSTRESFMMELITWSLRWKEDVNDVANCDKLDCAWFLALAVELTILIPHSHGLDSSLLLTLPCVVPIPNFPLRHSRQLVIRRSAMSLDDGILPQACFPNDTKNAYTRWPTPDGGNGEDSHAFSTPALDARYYKAASDLNTEVRSVQMFVHRSWDRWGVNMASLLLKHCTDTV